MTSYLNQLLLCGAITSYQLRTLDADGNEISTGHPDRVTDELTLTFPDGKTVVIDTLCDNCEENIALLIGRIMQ
jgi:hypothetical protein